MPPKTRRDYEVGYGKPPRDTRFKEGQSGNPRGRPPGLKNLRFFADRAAKKWPLRGSLKLEVGCL